MVILDGKEADSKVLKTMDAASIASVTILKGEDAVKKYGKKAKKIQK